MEIKYLLFVILAIFPLVSASILDIENENPQPHETIIGTLSSNGGIQTTLTKNNLIFYKDGAQRTPQEYNIYFYDEKYYFYFILTEEGNYSFVINTPITYRTGTGTISSERINLSMEIKYSDSENSILQVRPGVFYGYNPIQIDLNNKGKDKLEVSINEEDYTINPNDSERLEIQENPGIQFLEISSYKKFVVPIILLSKTIREPTEEYTNEVLFNNGVNFSAIIQKNEEEDYSINLKNIGEEKITNISIISEIDEINIISFPTDLLANETGDILIRAKFSEKGDFIGKILINYTINKEKKRIEFTKRIYVIEDETTFEYSNSVDYVICEDIGAEICGEGESIDDSRGGEIVFCNNTIGHIGAKCVKIGEENPTSSDKKGSGWAAILIVILILGLLGFGIYKKYKGVK